MSCNHPHKAFWSGLYTENGKKDYIIKTGTSGDLLDVASIKDRRISPAAPLVNIDGHTFITDPVSIPCGHCSGCRLMRAHDWSVRLLHESYDYFARTYFVTLTYDDSCLPFTKDGEPTLVKSDLSKFMKRLRRYSGRQFRFFGAGEYGENTFRPHYHLILFGDLSLDEQFDVNRFHSSDISKAWPFGLHEVSYANMSTMAYTAGYVLKKQKDPHFASYPVKPFILMSRKPALGSSYVSKLNGSEDFRVYGNFGPGVYSSRIPKAYLKKCEDESWYKDFKDYTSEITEDMIFNNLPIYGTLDEDLQGFCKDRDDLLRLEKVRISKL